MVKIPVVLQRASNIPFPSPPPLPSTHGLPRALAGVIISVLPTHLQPLGTPGSMPMLTWAAGASRE